VDVEQVAALEEQAGRDFAANLDAERAVVAAMLRSNDAVWTAKAILRPDDFLDGRNATLVGVIIRVVAGGGTADPIIVSEELERRKLTEQAGGIAYLFSLEYLGHGDVTHYAEIVKERAVRRALRDAAAGIAQLADSELETADVVTRSQTILERATARNSRRVAPIGEDVDSFFDGLETRAEHYSSPWESLDTLTGGFAPGRLYVIAARPGSGKTIMGVQIADALTRYGAVAYSSLEMERSEILGRLFASRGQINLSEMNGGEVTSWGWKSLAEHRSAIRDLPLFVDDNPSAYMADVQAHARAVARRQPLAGVVVDYLGLLSTPTDGKRQRWELFSEISRELKRMAKTLRVPVIALQQLSRAGDGDRPRPPVLSDIRDSGSIEQDADVVLLLHRATDDPKNAPKTLMVNAAKNRHGPTATFRLGWHGQTARLTQISHPSLPIDGLPDPEEQEP
jgi:replicative DNA helicase